MTTALDRACEISRERHMLDLLTGVEATRQAEIGWGAGNEDLFLIVAPKEGAEDYVIHHLGLWEWTVLVEGVQAEGATGDPDEDLRLLAEHPERLAKHLAEGVLVAVGFMWEDVEFYDDGDPRKTDEPDMRWLTAVDFHSDAYRVYRDRKQRRGNPVMAQVITPDADPYGPVLADLARGLAALASPHRALTP
ncbi:hypothetical protein ACFY05_32445 [Microtetraspora fusca]|uniref:Uncharacterized protein n=1 Tax=Microtetraspora fusca TaxID=1997 RepID=A0ABW6VH57_MICFU